MSSINTNVTTSTYTECDRLTKENIALENQLVSFKLKFAENSSKIMELEDQLSSIKRKLDLANDKHKTKDDIIKSLIQERDALRNEVIKYQDRSSIDNITTEFKMVTYFNNPKVTHKSSSNNNLPRVIKADNETKTNRSILIPTGKRDNSKKR